MGDRPRFGLLDYSPLTTHQFRRVPVLAALLVAAAVVGCSIYANLSFAVTKPASYRYFPPFKPNINANMNDHLGAEYFNIARSLAKGEGFANPFGSRTGPTAWMPPVLPVLEAGLLWVCDGNKDAVMTVVVFLQTYVLVATGLLVLALARQTTGRVGAGVAAGIFVAGLLCDFHSCFQITHDCWLVLLAVDLLIAGLCWCRPLRTFKTAAAWGLFGGLCALISPLVGFAWGILSASAGLRLRAWRPLGMAVLAAGLALAPWTVRNYRVFGRWIPVKSNAAYELYQSQCLQPDGLIQGKTFAQHPFRPGSREGREYQRLGETAFLERKRQQFWAAVRADPVDFLDRVACRFLGATLWYVPLDRDTEPRQRPWVFWTVRLVYPLPFLAVLVLVFTAVRQPLLPGQRAVVGVYLVYLLPYIGVSFYERYAVPLLGVKVLLVIWAVDRLLCFRQSEKPASDRPGLPVPPAPVGKRNRAAPVHS